MVTKELRRLDKFRLMSVGELSPWLVHISYNGKYMSPSNRYFNFYDEALEDCEEWLNEYGEIYNQTLEINNNEN